MKTVAMALCMALLLGALGISASARSDHAAAAAAALTPATDSERNRDHIVPPQDGDLPVRFDHISTEQGLSNLDVWSVLRDDHGLMWFATLKGLNRYDDYQMRVFKHDREDPPAA